MTLNISNTDGDPLNANSGSPFAITLHHINKHFGQVYANQDVSLDVRAGTIHGIIGENGAGKSTLMSILYGFYSADSGAVEVFGAPLKLGDSKAALAAGIGMVHQHFMLVPNFTALENIVLAHAASGKLADNMVHARQAVADIASRYGLTIELDKPVEELPVGVQQRIEIIKALYRGAKILILDEPTGVLTPQETDQLFEILDALRKQGVTVLLITHKLREIMAITDYVSVMRGGEMVDHLKTADTNPQILAEKMVGRKVERPQVNTHDDAGDNPSDSRLSVENLGLVSDEGVQLLKDISLELRAGEILGVAGVAGNGQSELLEVLSGITAPSSGRFSLGGRAVSADEAASVADLRAMGLAHVPEDRHAMGMVLPFSAAESAVLGYEHRLDEGSVWLKPERLHAHCQHLMESFDVRPPLPDQTSHQFSGGNQQKLVLAREISAKPDILLVGQPTRGVDIGAIEFIHKELLDLRARGCAILLVSVELDEILSLSDRIMVMNEGRNMGILNRTEADEHKIGLLMAGLNDAAGPEPTEEAAHG